MDKSSKRLYAHECVMHVCTVVYVCVCGSCLHLTTVMNLGLFPAIMNCPKLGIPLNGTFLSVNITYRIIAKE